MHYPGTLSSKTARRKDININIRLKLVKKLIIAPLFHPFIVHL